MKIIFGGTFDPVHRAHIMIANQLYKIFNSKNSNETNTFTKYKITIIPNNNPPYKQDTKANEQHRLNMLRLSFDDTEKFIIDTREIKKNAQYTPTINTLVDIQKQHYECFHQNEVIFFLIGSDSLYSLDTWDNYLQLLELTNLLVINRKDYDYNKLHDNQANLFDIIKNRLININNLNQELLLQTKSNGNIYLLNQISSIDISSTQIRKLIKNNNLYNKNNLNFPDSTKYLTQDVLKYIISNNLYN